MNEIKKFKEEHCKNCNNKDTELCRIVVNIDDELQCVNEDNLMIDIIKYLENDLKKEKKKYIRTIQDIADIFGKDIPPAYYKYKGVLEYIEILLSRIRTMDYSKKEW